MMHAVRTLSAAALVTLLATVASQSGTILLHDKGESPGSVAEVADTLRGENVLAVAPELRRGAIDFEFS
jgi:hypothetical protein